MGFWDFASRGATLLYCACSVLAAPQKRGAWKNLQTTQHGGVAFELGNQTYLANIEYPKAIIAGNYSAIANKQNSPVPSTVIFAGDDVVTGDYLQRVIASYLEADDVFSEDFLEAVYIASNSTGGNPKLDASALAYLSSLAPKHVFLDPSFGGSHSQAPSNSPITYIASPNNLTAGPYAASISETSIAFSTVYRLYRDSYRDFLYGTYDSNDGTDSFYPLSIHQSRFWDPMIPVPSRIYSWGDTRPLAGARVAIKDLYDMKGLVTSGGSQAWASITNPANVTAPSVQRIVDLGGVLVGKYKLAQFASGADPWEWQDEHYPFNPRGDGWLTCSASSSGGGCSVAAYDWLDFAIGSDTGSSMRRPAAVSGTYGNRPSQGMMSLEGVMPLGAATDTAGVFSRDVKDWVRFAKNWYIPELCQDSSITGLSPLVVPDSYGFPKRILYLTDYLPLKNPAAEDILQAFIRNMTTVFGMTVEDFNLTAVVGNTTDEVPKYGALNNATQILDTITQYQEVGKPLLEAWSALYDGRFPPIDPARRPYWKNYNESVNSDALYNESLTTKRAAVDWFESNILYSTPESCSESIMLWDIGTGGLPSYREASLNNNPNTTAFLAVTPPGAGINGASLCPIYGCVDMTIPIGQVPYTSNVTFVEEMVPVTVSVIAKRGCDFMLWNMWEKLADEGLLKTIKTGRTAF
ncbi:amidase family protein [Annulohypoxylon maeteangense]|uniref:amidase family protein n=1 Tax=Annulohypoxylon maeteangense TaxID=1927788 RepID=UPI0020077A15|nr:amidase family protein [Annulohypoxylon maeteangense]KAI0882640.1 amidase family protein [Annulohypoxylon maeteangense]